MKWHRSLIFNDAECCGAKGKGDIDLYVRPCIGGYEYVQLGDGRPWVLLENCNSMEEAKAIALVLTRME